MTEVQKDFMERIAAAVIKIAPEFGIMIFSPIIAQAILESGWGKSNKAKHNNFFGLKYREGRVTCHSGTFVDGSSEQNADGSYIAITDQWYEFATLEDGVRGYFQFINISRYSNLKGVTDWEEYIRLIREDGYATSLSYIQNLTNVVKNNNLTKFDKQEEKTMSNFKVHIDPGHYGSNYNHSTTNKKYTESNMTWTLSHYLKSELEALGITVTLSRTNKDADPGLYDRGYGAKGCNLFLSMHSNACGNESVDYPVVYRGYDKTEADAFGLKLANLIHDLMGCKQNGRTATRKGNNGEYYGVLRGARAAGLTYYYIIEHGFHTNSANTEWLLNDNNLKTLAKKEAELIASYFNVKNNTKTEKKEETKKDSTTSHSNNSTTSTHTTGLYRVTVADLNIRKGPGTNYDVVGCIKDKGTYTITEIKNGSWGKLKSGDGWINCHKNYCTKVNSTVTSTKNTITKKSNETIAKEVLQGKWGNGSERKKKLEAAGYNYSAIQAIVNKFCK